MSVHSFGGPWTQRKLGVVREYLKLYATALKNQMFQRIYASILTLSPGLGIGLINGA
jgi:hypothetical protein